MIKKGFTLIELLVVIGIIGVLAGMVIAVLNPTHFQGKSRDAKRKADLEQVRSALEMYRADTGGYPAGSGQISSVLVVLENPPYAYLTLPSDPKAGNYRYFGSQTSYELCASLEGSSVCEETGSSDSDCCGNLGCWGGSVCNYEVTNP